MTRLDMQPNYKALLTKNQAVTIPNRLKKCLTLLLMSCGIAMAGQPLFKNKLVTIEPGIDTFTLTVKANPTTGYQWSVTDYDSRQFAFMGSMFTHKDTQQLPKVGAPMWQVFKFKLLSPTITSSTITLSLGRSWEKNPIDSIRYTITQQ